MTAAAAAPDRLRREELQSRRQGTARAPGRDLPNGLKIKVSKLRGVESQGMLCSPKELGMSEDAAGLLILSPERKSAPRSATLFPNDTVLDVEITPNRGDLLSYFGLAREIAALTRRPLREPQTRSRKP